MKIPELRGWAEVPVAGPLRPLRLRLPVHPGREDRAAEGARRGLRRRRRLWHLHERADGLRPRRLARGDDGRLPELPVGRREAEHDLVVPGQLRGHGAEQGRGVREGG